MALCSLLLAMFLICSISVEVFGDDHTQLTLGEETERYTVECNQYKYFQVEATEPCQDLRIQVTHIEGEPNLYVSRGPETTPTFTSLAWSSYEWTSDSLTISSWDPEYVVGTYYIGVHAYCGSDVSTGNTPATFTVLAEHVATTHPHDEIPANGQISDNIETQAYKYYRFCLPSSCVNVDVGLVNCLDPSTCPTTYSYPELLVSRSIERPNINSHAWKLASVEVRSVSLRHDDPDFYPGHYFVGVYGWCTPDNLCSNFTTCGPCSYANNTEFQVTLSVSDAIDGCTPKDPLELCIGGTINMTSSLKVLILSLSLCWFMKTLS